MNKNSKLDIENKNEENNKWKERESCKILNFNAKGLINNYTKWKVDKLI